MKEYTLQELAKLTEGTLIGDPNYVITGVDSLEEATSKDASFLANIKYTPLLSKTQAGVVCVSNKEESKPLKNALICDDPSLAFQKILNALKEPAETGFTGIHETAVIHPSAKVGSDVEIGPYAVIDAHVSIGNGTKILAHTYIGPQVTIGKKCYFYSHVTVREGCQIQDRVVIQPGAVIGSCGFGFHTDAKGEHTKHEQHGIVILEEDVEIGAGTTIDRARFKHTIIGKGTKVDNLVQIGHNVKIGQNNLIVSQTGIAGSVSTGRNVVIGGQAGIAGHLHITDFVLIGAKGGVSKTIDKPGKYAGAPVLPLAEHNRQQVLLRNISSFAKQLKKLTSFIFPNA